MIIAGISAISRGKKRMTWHHVEQPGTISGPSRKDLRRKLTDYCLKPAKDRWDLSKNAVLMTVKVPGSLPESLDSIRDP
jgi:hypothetical protein